MDQVRRITATVPQDAAGQRLDIALARVLEGRLSRSQLKRLIEQGMVLVEGRPAKAAARVRAGQSLEVLLPPPAPTRLVPRAMELDVLYEDEHIIVVNKPPGIVVHPSPGHHDHTLVQALVHHCGALASLGAPLRPGIVHRLDKDTTGVLVAAKTDAAHRALVVQFASGAVTKHYLALVHGYPPASGELSAPIGRHPADRKRFSTRTRSPKPARTSWRVLKSYPAGVSLLKLRIYTGRTHQIRVHLAEAGYPVVGDSTYGIRRNRRSSIQAPRQMLHAAELGLSHPITAEPMTFTAPLPRDFNDLIQHLETDHGA